MRVMGVDPGLSRTGYAVVERNGSRLVALEVGVVETSPSLDAAPRLSALRAQLVAIVESLGPEVGAVERLFFNNNARTAIAVGQASGVALSVMADAGLEVREYTPSEVKQAVVGVGNASKDQVKSMITALLRLERAPERADAADACALAICHINRSGLARALARSGGRA